MKFFSPAAAALAIITTASASTLGSLRIMPLGGSITWGQGSQDGNGYRKILHDSLTKSGYSVDMVGSQRSGNMKDPDNESHPSYRITDLTTSLNTTFLTTPSSPQPQKEEASVVLLNPPVLDISQNHRLPSSSTKHTSQLSILLDKIFFSFAPGGTTVILSTLLPNSNEDTNARIEVVNKQLRALAEHQREGLGRKIVLAEMNDGSYITRQDLQVGDSTHPGEEGWRKMARKWREGIDEAEKRGFFAGGEIVDEL